MERKAYVVPLELLVPNRLQRVLDDPGAARLALLQGEDAVGVASGHVACRHALSLDEPHQQSALQCQFLLVFSWNLYQTFAEDLKPCAREFR